MQVACTDLLCVACIGLLPAEFSTVNTGLGRPMFWKPLCLLSTPEGLATHKLSSYIDYVNFQPKSCTFSKKLKSPLIQLQRMHCYELSFNSDFESTEQRLPACVILIISSLT